MTLNPNNEFKNYKPSFLKRVKRYIRYYLNKVIDKVQLTIIYAYVSIVQVYGVQAIFGEFPNHYYDLIPFVRYIFKNSFFRFFSSPDRNFIISFLIAEYFVFRSTFRLSIVVRFHILYLLILELFQNLCYYTIDFLFVNEFYPQIIPKTLLQKFVWNIYILFLLLSIYSYICGMRGKFPEFPGVFNKITASIAFWFRIKKVENKEEYEEK